MMRLDSLSPIAVSAQLRAADPERALDASLRVVAASVAQRAQARASVAEKPGDAAVRFVLAEAKASRVLRKSGERVPVKAARADATRTNAGRRMPQLKQASNVRLKGAAGLDARRAALPLARGASRSNAEAALAAAVVRLDLRAVALVVAAVAVVRLDLRAADSAAAGAAVAAAEVLRAADKNRFNMSSI
jgi:hypothetical protein